MRSTWLIRATRVAVGVALVAAVLDAVPAAAKPVPGRPAKRRNSLFSLTFGVMNVNNIFCGINNIGELCVDPNNSPVVGGGFWPKGTPDQYIFNSGLQLAGQIPQTAGGGKASFAWAGDTIGAFFMDPRGDQAEGSPITLVYNSLAPGDVGVNWPVGAYVRDTALYDAVLIARAANGFATRVGGEAISQQDLWVRTWDGNPAFLSGRTHPMGVLVEERGLAWNFPSGNEDIVYFIFTFYNVTARSISGAYNNPTIDPAVRNEIAAIGDQFQDQNEAVFGLNIPDGGYAFDSLFAAFFMDCDVGDAGHNYSTAVLPFSMAACYKSDFLEKLWTFPPTIFAPPIVPVPGFIGVKYLRSPTKDSSGTQVQIGLTLFSNTLNSGTGYPDPVGVKQLYRYLSGTSAPEKGDNPCTFQGLQLQLHFCFVAQTPQDTRFFQSSGPFTLPPGEARTIVVAYVQAGPTKTVFAYQGGDMKPGVPASGDSIVKDPSAVRAVDSAMGWISFTDKNVDGRVEQNEVTSVPRSLLSKALVAQAVFDGKFLLPFAPEAPRFFLIPGDNQVTIVWQKSLTEDQTAGGDPFFVVASNPTSPLYDANFRRFDVEGYRVYRGRSPSALEVVAQFDYAGTSIVDYTGAFDYSADRNGDGRKQCAPELATLSDSTPAADSARGGDCPVFFPYAGQPINPARHSDIDLGGNVIQIPVGGRVRLADGSVLVIKADTAVTGGASGFPALSNGGVAFAYVDRGVRNSFRYYYAVTAFDVNSFKSGPSSLESARITEPTTPRKAAGQEVAGALQPAVLLGGDGNPLPSIADPTLDPATGIFSGPQPPTNGIVLGLAAFVSQILTSGTVTATIDSIVPGATLNGRDVQYYVTAQGSGAPQKLVVPVTQDAFSADASKTVNFQATPINPAKSARYGGDASFSIFGAVTTNLPGGYRIASWGRGDINSDPANSVQAGPRWWAGSGNENVAKPNELVCTPADGACIQGDLSRNAGYIVDAPGDTVKIFHLASYKTVQNAPPRNIEGIGAGLARAADFKVFWAANGAIDSVYDVVHRIKVPFSTKMRASWGILNDSSFILGGTNAALTRDARNTILTWTDAFCVDPAPLYLNRCGGAAQSPAVLMNHARLSPVSFKSSLYDASAAALPQTGNGFTFYLNGHFFLMQLANLPSAGTVWNARFFSGYITGTGAAGDYAFTGSVRPPAVPGLRVQVAYTGSTFDSTATNNAVLARVHTVPDPYYVTNALEATANTKILRFVNLPSRAIIRIYSTSGVLVNVLVHNDPTDGGEETWNVRNRNNQFVASGVYFYHVEAADGKTKVGRFTIVNFAP